MGTPFRLPEGLDKNIIPLVLAMNKLPGIETIESCGGHKNPKAWQHPHGSFEIFFIIKRARQGLKSLAFLTWVCGWLGYRISIKPYINRSFEWGEHSMESFTFIIDGTAKPKEIIKLIEKYALPQIGK